MKCIIRIRGQVDINKGVGETLTRLRLGRKYTCVVLANPTKEQIGMIKRLKDFVAFGSIRKEVFENLIDARGQKIDKSKKIDSKKVIEDLEKGKSYESVNLKPFFRLHPPRGGIKSKVHFPKGVLGDNGEKINDLVLRML